MDELINQLSATALVGDTNDLNPTLKPLTFLIAGIFLPVVSSESNGEFCPVRPLIGQSQRDLVHQQPTTAKIKRPLEACFSTSIKFIKVDLPLRNRNTHIDLARYKSL